MPSFSQVVTGIGVVLAGISGLWWSVTDAKPNRHQANMAYYDLKMEEEKTKQSEEETKRARFLARQAPAVPLFQTNQSQPVPLSTASIDITGKQNVVVPEGRTLVLRGPTSIVLFKAHRIKDFSGGFMVVAPDTGQSAWTSGYSPDMSSTSVKEVLDATASDPENKSVEIFVNHGTVQFRT